MEGHCCRYVRFKVSLEVALPSLEVPLLPLTHGRHV
jgi:hypothetical protein